MWKKINAKMRMVGKVSATILALAAVGGLLYKIDQRYSKAEENGRRYAEYKQHEATAGINQIDLSLDTYRKFCGPRLENCKIDRDSKRVRELLEQRAILDTQRQEYWQRRMK